MSFQRTTRLRHFIVTQTYRQPSSRDLHIFPERAAHVQSTPLFQHARGIPAMHRQRRFATAAAEAAEPGTNQTPALLVTVPKREEIDPDEGVELLGEDDARVQLTERAAEKLRAISVGEKDPTLALRIAVESGGCHGYQYKMELTSQRAPDDYLFTHPTHRPASIVVDAVSLGLLKGSTIDYTTELIGSSFRVVDNPQAKGSGCGCGVSWEAKF